MTVQAAALEQTDERTSPDGWKQFLWLALGAVAYFVLGILGRTTIPDGEVLSLAWPAAGAAMLLFGLAPPRLWWWVAVLIAVTTVALDLLTGATGTQAGIFVVSNIAQAICAVASSARWRANCGASAVTSALEELRDFWPVLAGSVVGSLVGAVVGVLGRGVFLGTWSWTDLLVWWARNATGCVVIFTTVVLGGRGLEERTPPRRAYGAAGGRGGQVGSRPRCSPPSPP